MRGRKETIMDLFQDLKEQVLAILECVKDEHKGVSSGSKRVMLIHPYSMKRVWIRIPNYQKLLKSANRSALYPLSDKELAETVAFMIGIHKTVSSLSPEQQLTLVKFGYSCFEIEGGKYV